MKRVAFPDEFFPEFSRDVEPWNAPDGDAFYYQLVANVRRYKRKGTIVPAGAEHQYCPQGKQNH